VILLDANLLIYASSKSSVHHEAAHEWLDRQLNKPSRVGIPWPSLLGFLRVVTNPRIHERPATTDRAWEQIGAWLDQPNVWVPCATERHRSVLTGLLASMGSADVPAADLAALAIEHGLMLCSADKGFARFKGLVWMNPLEK
jgi:hypothetical protein